MAGEDLEDIPKFRYELGSNKKNCNYCSRKTKYWLGMSNQFMAFVNFVVFVAFIVLAGLDLGKLGTIH